MQAKGDRTLLSPPLARNLIAWCLVASLGAGCGALKSRSVVPKDQINTVRLEGYEHARYWGDQRSDDLIQTFLESWVQERAALKIPATQRAFPDSHHLAISGGGQNGAFGAGVLCGWSARGDRPRFNIVTGISTGALTAPFAFLGTDYDARLREVYTTVDQKDIAIFQGLLSLLRADSAYNTAPLAKLAEKYFDEQMLNRIAQEHRKGRRLLIGTTHLDAGRPMIWDIGRIACSGRPDRVKMFRQVLLASAAIPAAFPPVYIKVTGADGKTYDEMHVDGGVTREMFMLPSELRLYELRDQAGVERQAHLHVIRNARYGPEYEDVEPRVGRIAAASINTLIKAQATGDLWTLYYEAQANNMTYALTSIPDDLADDSKSMFDRKYMTRLFDTGFALGRSGKAWRPTPSYATTEPSTAGKKVMPNAPASEPAARPPATTGGSK
jgi:predicted patatin/cPLA2 family phospholipase